MDAKEKTFLENLKSSIMKNLVKVLATGIVACILTSSVAWIYIAPEVKFNTQENKKQDTTLIRHERLLNQQFLAPALQAAEVKAISDNLNSFIQQYKEDKLQTRKNVDDMYTMMMDIYKERTGKTYQSKWKE